VVSHSAANRWSHRGLGLCVAAATLILMLATQPWLAITWDEGYSIGRENRVRLWLAALADPARFAASWRPPLQELVQVDTLPPPGPEDLNTRTKLLSPRVIAWFWPFGREEPHGHPPFYAIVGLLGDYLVPWCADLTRARLGPILAFSMIAGAVWSFVSRRWGRWAAALASGAWVLQPNLFGHGHYASYDGLLSCLWVGSILAFANAVEPHNSRKPGQPHWSWVVVFGVLAGWAADTKLTGWFLPLPFLAWSLLAFDRRGMLTLTVGGLIAMVALYLFNPPWWASPIAGVGRFLESNLTRDKSMPISIQFLGEVIQTPNHSLPWYNTLVWTLFVTPVGFLLFALAGVVRSLRVRLREPAGVLIVFNWAFLLVLRAAPHTPGHDGVRLFLPAFGCLALACGPGAAWVIDRVGRWGKAAAITSLVEGALSVGLMMPVPLSYYSPLVGGLPGATALGMEPTYYWDALSKSTLDWLNLHTGPGDKVAFATNPSSWLYLKATGALKPNIFPYDRGTYIWYVIQNRPGGLRPMDRALIRGGKPSLVVSKWGVPLIYVFPYSELAGRQRATGREEGGR
jgi:hypothetical protein